VIPKQGLKYRLHLYILIDARKRLRPAYKAQCKKSQYAVLGCYGHARSALAHICTHISQAIQTGCAGYAGVCVINYVGIKHGVTISSARRANDNLSKSVAYIWPIHSLFGSARAQTCVSALDLRCLFMYNIM
jgi:hypothetical protein